MAARMHNEKLSLLFTFVSVEGPAWEKMLIKYNVMQFLKKRKLKHFHRSTQAIFLQEMCNG